ncbi:MAG: hypothetical protein AB7F35_18565 [Acetobacteraceae bacterium]
MSDQDILRKLRAIRNGRGRRSTLFAWMYEHHDSLLETLKGADWSEACKIFAEAGLTDITGKPANENTAMMTWYRARKQVEKDRQQRERGGSTLQIALTEIVRSNPAPVPRPAPAAPPASVEASPGTSAEPACIASLRRQIDERVLGAPRPMPVLAPPASIQSAAPGAFERYVAQREAALLGDKPAPEAPPSPKGAQAAPPADPTTPDATPRRRRRAY